MTALIPVALLRPLVDEWLNRFDTPAVGYRQLAAATSIDDSAWRKRLTDTIGTGWRGWWSFEAIDELDADTLLTAMGRSDLLAALTPSAAVPLISAKVRLPGETRRIKRLSRAALLTRDQIFAVHKLHTTGGLSMREISRRGWQQWGYSSSHSCLNSLCELLDSYGLDRRDRVAAAVAASTTHGRGARANRAAYKRWHRATFGPWPSDAKPAALPLVEVASL